MKKRNWNRNKTYIIYGTTNNETSECFTYKIIKEHGIRINKQRVINSIAKKNLTESEELYKEQYIFSCFSTNKNNIFKKNQSRR